MSNHPIQPLELDAKGVLRFKQNAIVRFMLDNGGIDMNLLAVKGFTDEDRQQFAQLIGYSHSDACDLGYMSNEILDAALAMYERGQSENEARVEVLRNQIEDAKDGMRAGVVALFDVHPSDLGDPPA